MVGIEWVDNERRPQNIKHLPLGHVRFELVDHLLCHRVALLDRDFMWLEKATAAQIESASE